MGVTLLDAALLVALGATFVGALWAFSGWFQSRNTKVAMYLMALAIYLVIMFLVIAPYYSVRAVGEIQYTTTTTIYDENGTPVSVNATVTRPVYEKNPAPSAYAPLVFGSALVLMVIGFVFIIADIIGWWKPV